MSLRRASRRALLRGLSLPTLALLAAGCAARPTLIDSDPATGFAIYRTGQLGEGDLTALCRQGVEEILVLNGNAGGRECRSRSEQCPGLRVRYNVRQSAFEPVSEEFLRAFDAWVEEARRSGRRIAFRCRHGWHRTGRLAAYYRIRYQGTTVDEAVEEMNRLGRFMWRHRQLAPQVAAMADFIQGRPCSVGSEHCLRRSSEAALAPGGSFPGDSCP